MPVLVADGGGPVQAHGGMRGLTVSAFRSAR